MVLLESTHVPLGSAAINFNLVGIDEKNHRLQDYKYKKALVIIFMCNHCPYVQAVWERLVNLQAKYADQGVQFIGINANGANENYPDDSFDKMKEYAADYNMNFPYLFDEDQSVAKAYKAQCTPDIYVYNADHELTYHGRIDDNWKDESAVTKHELDEAIAATVAGESVAEDQKPTMGCSIKWL